MKMESARITPTDDGAYMIECNDMDFTKSKKMVAKTLDDIPGKMREMMDSMEKDGAKGKKPKGNAKTELNRYLEKDEDEE